MADLDPDAPASARGGTATATKSGDGTAPRMAPRPRKPPPKIHTKASAGKLILIGLLGLAMLFGVGYAAGQSFTGGSGDTSASDVELSKDCEIVDTVPNYPPPSAITVLVLNAGSPPGSATTTGQELTGFGFVVSGIGDGNTDATTPTVIQHGPDARMAVQTLKAYLKGEVTLQEFPDAGNNVTLLLREGFPGVATATEAQAILTTPVPTPTGPGCTAEDAAKVPATTQG